MSHHLFLLSPSDTPIYSFSHQSTKQPPPSGNTLSTNLPTWSTSPFASTLTALSGAQSASSGPTSSGATGTTIGAGKDTHVIQMIANASLDAIEEIVMTNSGMYLKAVDKFNEWTISAFVTAGNMKFVLLHEAKNDEGIRAFFMDVWELYVKTAMNPFHKSDRPIRSLVFDKRVQTSAKKHL